MFYSDPGQPLKHPPRIEALRDLDHDVLIGITQGHGGRHQSVAPWHFLNFLPDPQGQGSLRPTLVQSTLAGTGDELSERVRPAPTTTGSRRVTTSFFGGSSAAMSMTSSGPVPLPSPFELSTDSSGMSSRMPRA